MIYHCPVDGTRLEAKIMHGGGIHTCPTCSGEMINYAVLKNDPALKKSAQTLWRQARSSLNNDGVACPECGSKMSRITSDELGCEIDLCLRCQLVWFDKSEYDSLPREEIKKKPEGIYDGLDEKTRDVLLQFELDTVKKRYKDFNDPTPTGYKFWLALFGFPIEDDDIVTDSIPYWNFGIVGLCVLAFVLSLTDLRHAIMAFGFVPSMALRYAGGTILTSFFMHAGWWHLISNMYYLVFFGDNVQEELGPTRYIMLLFFGHFIGTLLYMILSPVKDIPSVGASAGISAVLVYYIFLFPKSSFRYMFFVWSLIPVRGQHGRMFYTIRIKAFWFLVIWIGIQLINSIHQVNSAEGGVNAIAHLGGALVGLGWAYITRDARKMQ